MSILDLRHHGLRPYAWPVVLDLAEWFEHRAPSSVLSAINGVIAPRYEDVKWSTDSRAILSDDVGADLDSDRLEIFLRTHLLEAINTATIAEGDVVLLPSGRLRPTDRYFLGRLQDLRACRQPTGNFVVNTPGVTGKRRAERLDWATADSATRAVSACPQGMPADSLRRLGVDDFIDESLLVQVVGPDYQVWYRLRESSEVTINPADRERLVQTRRDIFDTWPVEGWGYIRSLPILLLARPDVQELASHYEEALYGFSGLWRTEDLWKYVLTLIRRGLRSRDSDAGDVNWVGAVIALSRTAPDRNAEKLAARLIQEVETRWSDGPLSRARLQYELGNIYARFRKPPYLNRAGLCLDRAFAELEQVDTSGRSEQMRAQIANTRALVAYHDHRDFDALKLEQEAEDIARATGEAESSEWVDSALAMNRARLLERRFGDIDGALELIRQLVTHSNFGIRARAVCDVTRYLLYREDWHGVIDVVDNALSTPDSMLLREDEEVLLELTRVAALLALECDERATNECVLLANRNQILRYPLLTEILDACTNILSSRSLTSSN